MSNRKHILIILFSIIAIIANAYYFTGLYETRKRNLNQKYVDLKKYLDSEFVLDDFAGSVDRDKRKVMIFINYNSDERIKKLISDFNEKNIAVKGKQFYLITREDFPAEQFSLFSNKILINSHKCIRKSYGLTKYADFIIVTDEKNKRVYTKMGELNKHDIQYLIKKHLGQEAI